MVTLAEQISRLREPETGRWSWDVGKAPVGHRAGQPLGDLLSSEIEFPASLNAGDVGAHPRGCRDEWMNVQGEHRCPAASQPPPLTFIWSHEDLSSLFLGPGHPP